jgi:hypothetical protein
MIIVSEEIRERLLRSTKFHDWDSLLVNPRTPAKSRTRTKTRIQPTPEVTERHYSVSEVARLWGISTDMVRDIFRKEPGVLSFRRPGTRTKRSYSTIRVPHSVLVRVKESVSQ